MTVVVTTVSDGDLMAIGMVLLNTVVAVERAGHASPSSTLDYLGDFDSIDGSESAAPAIVRDFIAWTCGRKDLSPGCDERLKAFTHKSGWHDQVLEQVTTRRRPRRAS